MFRRRVLIALGIIFVIITLISTFSDRRAARAENSIQGYEIIAHRGFEDQYPENTVFSAIKALKLGVPVEFDVHFTLDGEMVVIHDDTVDRTTNGTGRVKELNSQYIRELDAGIKFSKKYKGVKVPKFQEYLDSIRDMTYIYPELKDYRNAQDIERFTRILINNQFEYRATVLSFGYQSVLPEIRKVSKDIKVGALSSNQETFESNLRIAKKDRNSVMAISKNIANLDNLNKCKESNIDVLVWTVRSDREVRELKEIGYRKFISSRYIEIE